MIVDGHVQGEEAGMLAFAAQPSIATQAHLREPRHAFDIEMQEVAGCVVLVALNGWRRVQVAPSAQPGTTQDATDRGRTHPGAARDLVGRAARAREVMKHLAFELLHALAVINHLGE